MREPIEAGSHQNSTAHVQRNASLMPAHSSAPFSFLEDGLNALDASVFSSDQNRLMCRIQNRRGHVLIRPAMGQGVTPEHGPFLKIHPDQGFVIPFDELFLALQ